MICRPSTPEAYQLVHEGSIALSEVSSNGIQIDTEYLTQTRNDLQSEIKTIERELKKHEYWKTWVKVFGQKSNIHSGDQLAHLLYKQLKYPIVAFTDKGKPKTDAESLEYIDDPFVRRYNRLAKLRKADGTFLAGIERETSHGILRCFFNLHTTVTFRGSSDYVNFQNFPIRDEEIARMIRQCFIPRHDRKHKRRIVEIDCSGVEVRISACYNKDPKLIEYILDPRTDMHRDMACQIFMIEESQVSKPVRHTSKNGYVFPSFYGSTWKNTAKGIWDAMALRNLTIPHKGKNLPAREWLKKKGIEVLGSLQEPRDASEFAYHMQQVDNDFWNNRFRVYSKWKDEVWANYLRTGGWKTYTGFVVTGLYPKTSVTNHRIQGSAFQCLLWALIRLQKWLKKYKMKTKIIGQIHDSIVLDAVESELQDVLNKWDYLIRKALLKAWKWIIVPIETEVEAAEIGRSWFYKEPWVQDESETWVPKNSLAPF